MSIAHRAKHTELPRLEKFARLSILLCALLIIGCATVEPVSDDPFSSLPVPELPKEAQKPKGTGKQKAEESAPPSQQQQEGTSTAAPSSSFDFSIPGLTEEELGFPENRPANPMPDTLTGEFDAPVDVIVTAFISSMTLKEKVGQLFILDLGAAGAPDAQALTEGTAGLIRDFAPGGFILFSRNLSDIVQTSDFIKDLQDASEIPLFISTDQEGGIVSRLTDSATMNATHLPSEWIIGKTGNPAYARLAAEISAKELYSLGVNMNFAPVADVVIDVENSVIGSRAYGSDPYLTGDMVAAAVEGMQAIGVSSVVKHFPGHGRVRDDTHEGTASLSVSAEDLRNLELIPFERAVQAGCDGIMTAHITLPEVLDETTPATFSSFALKDVLRGMMDYKGLIVTDSLNMGAIDRYWTPSEAAVYALRAGVDILLMPKSHEAAFDGIMAAIDEGLISEQRIDESVRRILTTKLLRGVLQADYRNSTIDPTVIVGSDEHRAVADEIRRAAQVNSSN